MTNMDAHGIRYTLFSCNSIDSDVLHELLYTHGKDLSYEAACKEHLAQEFNKFTEAADELAIARAESGADRENPDVGEDDLIFDEEALMENFDPMIDEPIIAGVLDGVTYQTTWLGGAQLLFCFRSPVVGHFALCSPCAPGAADGNSRRSRDEGYMGFDLPPSWFYQDPEDVRTFADRLGTFE